MRPAIIAVLRATGIWVGKPAGIREDPRVPPWHGRGVIKAPPLSVPSLRYGWCFELEQQFRIPGPVAGARRRPLATPED